MKRSLKRLLFALPIAATLLAGGVGWYALSEPPVENLPLASDLVAATSTQGRELLTASPGQVDYAQLERLVRPQIRRGFCGPATSAAVINAALHPPIEVTQASLFNPAASAVKSELAVSLSGMTLDELAGVMTAHGLQVRVIHTDQSDLAAFRTAAREVLAEPLTFLVVNYDRRALGQSGAGHISPLGAFSPDTDRVLVLDVAAHKYPYTWVPVARLWDAMNTVDTDSGRKRGYLLVTAGRPAPQAPASSP